MIDLSGYEEIKERHAGRRKGHSTDEETQLAAIDPGTLEGAAVPDRKWLVPDWVPLGRATALYGAGGEGKTLLAQMLATACALGALWLGLSSLRCNSLLFFCEDDLDEMHRRQHDINRFFRCTFADLTPMRWLPRLGCDNALMTFNDGPERTPLFDQLLNTAQQHEAKLVIVDTLADVFVGNENDRGQARMFAQAVLGLIARESGGAVLALAHPSRNGMNSGSGESGSTAWIGTFRSQLYLSTPKAEGGEQPDPDTRILTRKKANAARRDEAIELCWADGVFRPAYAATGILGTIERRAAENVFLELLDKMEAARRPLSDNTHSGNYAPRQLARLPKGQRDGHTLRDFEAAMASLFAQHQIEAVEYGRPSDPKRKIARVAR